jgi:hypothetical protein
MDASTHEALPNVNVFLTGTSLGAATDRDGKFQIRHVPLAAHELVVSLVGYQRQTVKLQIFEPTEQKVQVQLAPVAIETQTVEVVAKDPKAWREQYTRFEKEFLGETRNAAQCRIINPERLEFKVEGDRFEMTTSVPVIVENRALGYRVEFLMEEFLLEQYTLQYRAKTKFQELTPRDEQELSRWKESRRRAYHGSRQHFLKALARGATRREGFDVSLVPTIRPLGRNSRPATTLANPEQYVFDTEFNFQKRLQFPDYLQIVYTRERADPDFRYTTDPWEVPSDIQVSWLALNRLSALFTVDGHTVDSYSLKVYGYWAFERVAELLPMDYEPSDQ